jgi:hypothetical protein
LLQLEEPQVFTIDEEIKDKTLSQNAASGRKETEES